MLDLLNLTPLNPRTGRPHGWSLVELMLAIALGLLLLSALLSLVIGHVDEQRRLLLESRLTQDLRTAIELISRDLRRSAYWGDVSAAVWDSTRPTAVLAANPYRGVALSGPDAAPWLGYSYSRDLTEDHASSNQEKFGLRLNTSSQVLEWRMSGSAVTPDERDHWQALTDPAVLQVTQLSVRLLEQRQSLLDHCPGGTRGACDALADCPPQRIQRSVRIVLSARDTRDPRLQRTLSSDTRLRNDEVRGVCPS